MSLLRRSVLAVFWSAATHGSQIFIRFITLAVLARFLTPGEFGLAALVFLFTNGLTIFVDLGLPSAAIQRKELNSRQLSSIFWVCILCGAIIALLSVCLAYPFASICSEARLILLIQVASLQFVMNPVSAIPSALLQRELQFKVIAKVKVCSASLGAIVAIALAYLGFGAWSLVWQALASQLLELLVLTYVCPWRPDRTVDWGEIRQFSRFGFNFIGFSFLNYLIRNADDFLIGKFLGLSALGIYNVAYKVLILPVSGLTGPVSQVAFPLFSKVQDDRRRVAEGYRKSIEYISLTSFPLACGLFVTADEFVHVALGTQWERSIFLIRIFAITGMVESIGSLNGVIYMATGRTDIQFRLGMAFSLIYLTAFVVGLRWDIEGVAMAYSLVSILLTFPSIIIATKLIGLDKRDLINTLRPYLLSAVVMGAAVHLLTHVTPCIQRFGEIVSLGLAFIIGGIVYLCLIALFNREIYSEFRHVLNSLLTRNEQLTNDY